MIKCVDARVAPDSTKRRETPAGIAANNSQWALTSTSETIQQKWLESANKSVRDMMNEALSACGRRKERGGERDGDLAPNHHHHQPKIYVMFFWPGA